MDFGKLGGLVPAVIQDHLTREVLMVGFMNDEAYSRTCETGYVTFYSRTRERLWTKGETSGNKLAVVSIATDCDEDTLLIQARCEGDGNVCHTGQRTCFVAPQDPASIRPGAASELRERAARTEWGGGAPASERAGGPWGEAPGPEKEAR
jgi:phosphoribosyl-ATP pyrophosphohydrolase/phosphoribosyl-AMP cyclohydrolase